MPLLTSPDIEKEIEEKRTRICEGASLQLVPVLSLVVLSIMCDGYPFVPTHIWGMANVYSVILLPGMLLALLNQYRGPLLVKEVIQVTFVSLLATSALALFILVVVTFSTTRYLEPLCAFAVLLGVIRCTERQYWLLQLANERHDERSHLTAQYRAEKWVHVTS
jgi:hypothetical protein